MKAIRITRACAAAATARAGDSARLRADRAAAPGRAPPRAPPGRPSARAQRRPAAPSAAPGACGRRRARARRAPRDARATSLSASRIDSSRTVARSRAMPPRVPAVGEGRHVEEDGAERGASPAARGPGRRGCRSEPSSGPVASRARRVKHMPWSCPRFQRNTSRDADRPRRQRRARPRARSTAPPAPYGSSSGGSMRPFWITRSTSGCARRYVDRHARAGRAAPGRRSRGRRRTARAPPRRRRCAPPRCRRAGRRRTRTRGSRSRASSAGVSSVEPSSTTTTSRSTPACASRLVEARRAACGARL